MDYSILTQTLEKRLNLTDVSQEMKEEVFIHVGDTIIERTMLTIAETLSEEEARLASKQLEEGDIEATSVDNAIILLQKKGIITILEVKEKVDKDSNIFKFVATSGFFKQKIKQKDIVLFSRQVSTLFEAGVSALRALASFLLSFFSHTTSLHLLFYLSLLLLARARGPAFEQDLSRTFSLGDLNRCFCSHLFI
jgi:hypothetical protein